MLEQAVGGLHRQPPLEATPTEAESKDVEDVADGSAQVEYDQALCTRASPRVERRRRQRRVARNHQGRRPVLGQISTERSHPSRRSSRQPSGRCAKRWCSARSLIRRWSACPPESATMPDRRRSQCGGRRTCPRAHVSAALAARNTSSRRRSRSRRSDRAKGCCRGYPPESSRSGKASALVRR